MRAGLFAAALVALCSASPAAAQGDAPRPEREGAAERARSERAEALRAEGRRASAEGRLEDAFAAHREAAATSEDAAALLELAEAADRLRVDDVALEAYEAYLRARPDVPDRAALEGRLRVLRELLHGGRYVPVPGGHAVRLLVDWQGRPRRAARRASSTERAGAGGELLVDWQGQPMRAPSPAARPIRITSGIGRLLASP